MKQILNLHLAVDSLKGRKWVTVVAGGEICWSGGNQIKIILKKYVVTEGNHKMFEELQNLQMGTISENK